METPQAFSRRQEKSVNLHLTPGRKPVLECVTTRPQRVDTVFLAEDIPGLGEILQACKQNRVRYRKIPRQELDRMYSGAHQGVIARLRGREFMDLPALLDRATRSPLPLILALDQIQDPGNAGTLARTLLALGGGGLLFRSVGLGSGRSQGRSRALDHLPLCQVTNLARALDTCRDAGFSIYGSGLAPQAVPLFPKYSPFRRSWCLGTKTRGYGPMWPNVVRPCYPFPCAEDGIL